MGKKIFNGDIKFALYRWEKCISEEIVNFTRDPIREKAGKTIYIDSEEEMTDFSYTILN